jgi:hypothetical protein
MSNMNQNVPPSTSKTENKPVDPDDEVEEAFLKLDDDEYRDLARKLHGHDWVIEVDDDAVVQRPTCQGECARVHAVSHLGPHDIAFKH